MRELLEMFLGVIVVIALVLWRVPWLRVRAYALYLLISGRHKKNENDDRDNAIYENDDEIDDFFDSAAYYVAQQRYTQATAKFFSGYERIEALYSEAYHKKDFFCTQADECVAICKWLIADVQQFINANEEQYKEVPPSFPPFFRLSMIYERRGQFPEALDVCVQAIQLGFESDGGKGMRVRLARLIKKANVDQSVDELISGGRVI